VADESYVQVAPNSTGPKIRNLQLNVLQPDGTTATVQMQVVSIVDLDGRATNFGANETIDLLRSLLRELTTLRQMYGRATGLQVMALDGAMWDDIIG